MRVSSITKNAVKVCNNRLYRHIRAFEKIIKNYFVIFVTFNTLPGYGWYYIGEAPNYQYYREKRNGKNGDCVMKIGQAAEGQIKKSKRRDWKGTQMIRVPFIACEPNFFIDRCCGACYSLYRSNNSWFKTSILTNKSRYLWFRRRSGIVPNDNSRITENGNCNEWKA